MKDKITLEVVSYQSRYLTKFMTKMFSYFQSKTGEIKVVPLPKKRKLFSVLKSPFVNKKAVEQFSLKKYKRVFILEKKRQNELKEFLKVVPLKNVAIKLKGG